MNDAQAMTVTLSIVPNTAAEIEASLLEMLDRPDAVITYSESDRIVQQAFNTTVASNCCIGSADIGRHVLQDHIDLLYAAS